MSNISLHYDPVTACWLDTEGNAWQIAVLSHVVNETRKAEGATRCTFCRRDQKTNDHRRLHMLTCKKAT